jgi:hypothetical protein
MPMAARHGLREPPGESAKIEQEGDEQTDQPFAKFKVGHRGQPQRARRALTLGL